jgi:hypothetical protein
MGKRFIGASHWSGQTENACQQTEPGDQKSKVSNAHEAEWAFARAIILQ